MSIEIPDDINQLSLAIQDRIALATMRKRPRIGNSALAKLLGLSDSGTRTLIRRLRAYGLIREVNIDGKRVFKVLVGDQKNGSLTRQNLTKSGTLENRQKMTDEPPPGLTRQERSHWKAARYVDTILEQEKASRTINRLHMSSFFMDRFGDLVRQIAADPDLLEADRNHLLQAAETKRNFYAAAYHIELAIPVKDAPAALEIIRRATPGQLAEFYERIQSGQLQGCNDPLLLGVGVG